MREIKYRLSRDMERPAQRKYGRKEKVVILKASTGLLSRYMGSKRVVTKMNVCLGRGRIMKDRISEVEQ